MYLSFGTSKLLTKPSALQRGHPTLQNMNFEKKKILLLWVIFALLDPDPDPLTRLNPDPIRIQIRFRIRNPAPWEPPILYSCRESELVTLLKKGTYPVANSKSHRRTGFWDAAGSETFCFEEFPFVKKVQKKVRSGSELNLPDSQHSWKN